MEPQGGSIISPLRTRRQRPHDLRKTTLQTVRLNAQKQIGIEPERGVFSVDIPSYRTSAVTSFTRSWRSDDTNKKVYLLDAQDKVEPRVGERAQMKGTHQRTSLMNVNEFDRQRVMALMDGKTLRFTVSQRNSFLCVWTPQNA